LVDEEQEELLRRRVHFMHPGTLGECCKSVTKVSQECYNSLIRVLEQCYNVPWRGCCRPSTAACSPPPKGVCVCVCVCASAGSRQQTADKQTSRQQTADRPLAAGRVVTARRVRWCGCLSSLVYTVTSQRRYSDVTVVLQWCYRGFTVVLPWCHSGLKVVLQWCYYGVTLLDSPEFWMVGRLGWS
jgi:hypothetical protein